MKFIPLTQNKQAMVDDSDYDQLIKYKWQYNGGYAKTGVKTVRMNRFILNAPVDKEVSYVNNNKLDNRRVNLKITQKKGKTTLRKDNTSGIRGINFLKDKNTWIVRLPLNGKRIFIGSFKSKGEAIMAHSRAIREYMY